MAIDIMYQTYKAQRHAVPLTQYLVIVLASLLIMACSGAVYAWSIFVAPLKAAYGLTTADTQLVFGCIIACFTIVMLFVNKVERRYGPKYTAAIGAVLFSAGYLLASFSGGNLIVILMGISVLSGAGMAFGYVTVLTTLVKWFPQHKGLATGIAVAGFGGGAILLSQIAQPLLGRGLAVTDIFRIVGMVYGILFFIGALALAAPRTDKEKSEAVRVSIPELLKDRRFWVLFYTFFAGSFAGLLFIGNLKPIGLSYGVSEGAAMLAISLIAVGNALGRVVWGQVHDMVGGRTSVIAALLLLSSFTLLLLVGVRNDITFVALSFILGLCFGANFVLYASDVSHIYGIFKLGIIYPIVSLAYGIAGVVGPLAGGMISDITKTYYIPIILAAAVCASGVAVYALGMPGKKTEALKAFKPELKTSEG